MTQACIQPWTGRLAGAVGGVGADVVECGIAVDDLEGHAGLHGDDVRDVAATELADFDFGRRHVLHELCRLIELWIDNPDHDIAECTLRGNLPVLGAAGGPLPAAGDWRVEGFVLAVGFAGNGDRAGDVCVGVYAEEKCERKNG